MRRSATHIGRVLAIGVCAVAMMAFGASSSAKDSRPSIAVKASPAVGFAPMRIVLTADINGGPDDYQEFYCASVEWDMGDGNKSEQNTDCDPYEPGKSQIKRRYVKEQVFQVPGDFRVLFSLKQKDKVVATGRTTIRVRPGLYDRGN
jgi:hypothetical protein